MTVPGSDRRIVIKPNPRRVVVSAGGRQIADTTRALLLGEGGSPPVQYIPREDVEMSRLVRTDHSTSCPVKGRATYYSIRIDDTETLENAVWTYEEPHAVVEQIRGHLAFYRSLVDSIEEIDS